MKTSNSSISLYTKLVTLSDVFLDNNFSYLLGTALQLTSHKQAGGTGQDQQEAHVKINRRQYPNQQMRTQ